MQQPCKNCPFSRASEPGALGGSPPETFIGQAAGPFVLPCHSHCDFDDPNWKAKILETPQCAGAAIFRSHINVTPYLPAALHTLPSNTDRVFSSSAEFLAHHKKIGLSDAVVQLKLRPPAALLREQLNRQHNQYWPSE